MEEGMDLMVVALRVLSALIQERMPKEQDANLLRASFPASQAPLDELACGVIQGEMKKRPWMRRARIRAACQ